MVSYFKQQNEEFVSCKEACYFFSLLSDMLILSPASYFLCLLVKKTFWVYFNFGTITEGNEKDIVIFFKTFYKNSKKKQRCDKWNSYTRAHNSVPFSNYIYIENSLLDVWRWAAGFTSSFMTILVLIYLNSTLTLIFTFSLFFLMFISVKLFCLLTTCIVLVVKVTYLEKKKIDKADFVAKCFKLKKFVMFTKTRCLSKILSVWNKAMSKVVKKKLFFLRLIEPSQKRPQPQSEISDKKKAKICKSFFHYACSKKSFFFFYCQSIEDT